MTSRYVVIVPSDAVLGVIEVKTSLKRDKIAEIIDKAAMVNSLFSDQKIFNGIFAFDNNVNWNREGRLDVVYERIHENRKNIYPNKPSLNAC